MANFTFGGPRLIAQRNSATLPGDYIVFLSSTGDAEDAVSDGSNHKIESESDGSVATSGRGRSFHDRRQGTGNAVKREKTEPVPVSPPRPSIIAAAYEAKVGSQIKVRFDTGDWFSGIISEVHKQRYAVSIYFGECFVPKFSSFMTLDSFLLDWPIYTILEWVLRCIYRSEYKFVHKCL